LPGLELPAGWRQHSDMRIVYMTLLLIVLLNFGNPCDLGLRKHPDPGGDNAPVSDFQ